MFLVHYAVLAAFMALPQVPVKLIQALPPAPPAAQPQAQPQAQPKTQLQAQPQPQARPQPQEPVEKPIKPDNGPSSTALVPQQIRKAEPPPPNATAQELEDTADDLRGEKAFADALDYYHAAMTKADSSALHNKVGITYLEMLRYDAANREFDRSPTTHKAYTEPYNTLAVVEY